MRFFLIALVFLSAVGCQTTAQSLAKLNEYQNKNADIFFKKFGMPAGQYQFSDKSKVYRWSSGVINYNMPSVTSYNGTVNDLGSFYAQSSTVGGFIVEVECTVDLLVTPDNLITEIKIIKDTLGQLTTSRCGEFFLNN